MADKKILVIDDEPDVVTFLTTLMEDAGYQTVSASNGAEGIAKAKDLKPDLITLDISMPEKTGVKFFREVQEAPETKGIPVVMITGVSKDFKEFIEGRKQVTPPAGYLSKPVQKDELLKLLDKLLG